MKEDYLWDKSGSDAEIQRLENALSAFRLGAEAVPPVPMKLAPGRSIFRPKAFALRFAQAFCAIAVVAAGLWTISSHSGPSQAGVQTVEQPAETEVAEERSHNRFVPDQTAATPAKYAAARDTHKNQISRNRAFPREGKRRRGPEPARRNSQPALTSEERYAYDQLRLALSISGSKLKIIRETMDGSGEEPRRTERR